MNYEDVLAYYGVDDILDESLDTIQHSGIKGMLWGFTKGLANGGRKAIKAIGNTVNRGRNALARRINSGRYDDDFNERRGSGIRRKISRAIGTNEFDREQDLNDEYNRIARKRLNAIRPQAMYNNYNRITKTNTFDSKRARDEASKYAKRQQKALRNASNTRLYQ